MENQTESHTEIRPSCAEGQVVFVLKAQDICADLLVDLWAWMQREILHDLANGMTVDESLECLRVDFQIPITKTGIPKLDEALTIAEAMRAHPTRRLPD